MVIHGEACAIVEVGDTLETLKRYPAGVFNCCVTSPPYFGLRNYGMPGQMGLETTPEAYTAALVALFREVWRVLRDDGTLWLNLGDSYASFRDGKCVPNTVGGEQKGMPVSGASVRSAAAFTGTGIKSKDLIGIPWRVAFALQADGWYLRQDIIWHKPNPMPESVTDRCTKAHEYIFMLSKSSKYYCDMAAIAEPLASTSLTRLSQPTLDEQEGSARAVGKTNGNLKAVMRMADNTIEARTCLARLDQKSMPTAERNGIRPENKQDGHGRRHAGFNARYFGSDKPYTGQSTKNYAAGGAQNASDTKRRIVDRILAGEILTRNKRDVWTVTTKPFKGAHFATFPPDLIEPCILAGCPVGGLVLDTFGGSGTTAGVSLKHGRNAIVCEINPEFAAMLPARCEKILL